MDDRRFDGLTRELAAGTSRRRAFKLLAGAALGTALTRMAAADAGAATTCRRNGRRCRTDAQCCSGECHRDVCRRDRERD